MEAEAQEEPVEAAGDVLARELLMLGVALFAMFVCFGRVRVTDSVAASSTELHAESLPDARLEIIDPKHRSMQTWPSN